jgi:dihydrodipicolinate synthase/N-acetylneuraminate lyase
MTAIPMIQGTWNTLLLPLNSHGSIDWERLEANVDALIESEVSGVYTNGTAGEFYNQTEEEFDRISVMMAERCRKADRPFQIGVSHSSPWQSRERLRRVAELDPLAFQVILPEWFPPVLEECRIFIEEMAAAAGGRP